MRSKTGVWCRRLVVALVAAAAPLAAASDDLSIRADETIVEDGGDRKVLRGNVIIEFGHVTFQADRVVQSFADGEPVKYEASGNPVVLEQTGGALQGLEQGTAEELVYLVDEKTLLLTNYELRLSNGSVQRGKKFKFVFPQ